MVYHPMTTKGNSNHVNQFNFDPADIQKQQIAMSLQPPNTSPTNKRSTSVKHSN